MPPNFEYRCRFDVFLFLNPVDQVSNVVCKTQSAYESVNAFYSANQSVFAAAASSLANLNGDSTLIEATMSAFTEYCPIVLKGLDSLGQLHPFIGGTWFDQSVLFVSSLIFLLFYSRDQSILVSDHHGSHAKTEQQESHCAQDADAGYHDDSFRVRLHI